MKSRLLSLVLFSAPFAWSICAFSAPPVSVGERTFIAKATKLWTEPNRFGEPTAQLKTGLPVEVLDYDASRSWIMVRTPSGREGWLPLRFTSQDSRRTQPVISHKAPAEDASRSPAGFEETLAKESAAPVDAAASSGRAFEGSLGYGNQLNHESAHGFGMGVAVTFPLAKSFLWGAGIDWRMHFKSSTADDCFSNETCTVSRRSHRIFPHAFVRLQKDAFGFGVGLGFAIDRSSITTKDANGNTIEESDNGSPLSGSSTEFRMGIRLGARYDFDLSPGLVLGPYLDYDLDIALSNGEGELIGEPVGRVFHSLGGGVFIRKTF